MSVVRAQKLLKVSNPTARKAVMLLQQKGLLKEMTGREWGKLYLAAPIMDVIEQRRTTKV
jgi:predicted DNA-binding transcriptional regulator